MRESVSDRPFESGSLGSAATESNQNGHALSSRESSGQGKHRSSQFDFGAFPVAYRLADRSAEPDSSDTRSNRL